MGHWWQAGDGTDSKSRKPYQIEYDANRISVAYWREINPALVGTVMPIFQGVYDHAPARVPASVSVEEYFNKNYTILGPSPAYPWFMSRMNLNAYSEKPAPTFAKILAMSAK